MAIVEKTLDNTLHHAPPYQYLVRSRDVQKGFIQKPLEDKTLPLQYSRSIRFVANHRDLVWWDYPWDAYSTRTHAAHNALFNSNSELMKLAHDRAWSKLQQALQWVNGVEGDRPQLARASLGVSLAEGKEAIAMIVDRSTRLFKAFKALKEGRFISFLEILGTRPLPHHRKTKWTRPKDASALWLEYWLGWAPTVQDIYNCIDVLQSDFGAFAEPLTIRGRGKAATKIEQRDMSTHGGTLDASSTVTVELGCQVRIANPNLLLANQLGLVNPASVAWAIVPFSFIVGWFSNVQLVLDSFTEFVGLEVTRKYTTRTCRTDGSETRWYYLGSPSMWSSSVDTYAYDMTRSLDLELPKLRAWVPSGLSLTRGATAMSLLVSIFTKG